MIIRDELYYQNRLNLLSNRGRENGRIIKKLQRKLRNLAKRNG